MKRILVFGAGKSSTALIDYFIENALAMQWLVVIADANLQSILKKIDGRASAEALQLDIFDEATRGEEIAKADFVISLLPPALHIHVAKDCVSLGTSLVSASYVSEEIQQLDYEAQKSGVLLMNELGADPGIDHMSAMEIIERLRDDGAEITSFQSYCGGLIAPESDTNPWHYKVSWNPWNIVRAGSGGADFLMNGNVYHRKYEQLYKESNLVDIPNYGTVAAYPNRDSLKYIDTYALKNAHTVLRATLRHPDFVEAWSLLIDLGITAEEPVIDIANRTYQQWFLETSKHIPGGNLQEKLMHLNASKKAIELIAYLQLNSLEPIPLEGKLPAGKVLQEIIERVWRLQPEDKDLLIFHHDIEYAISDHAHQIESTLTVKGDNAEDTAMAKCVGLPLAIFTKLFLTGEIKGLKGVQIPTDRLVYKPILAELKQFGILFEES